MLTADIHRASMICVEGFPSECSLAIYLYVHSVYIGEVLFALMDAPPSAHWRYTYTWCIRRGRIFVEGCPSERSLAIYSHIHGVYIGEV